MPQLINVDKLEAAIAKLCDKVLFAECKDRYGGRIYYGIGLKSSFKRTHTVVYEFKEAKQIREAIHYLGIPYETEPEQLLEKFNFPERFGLTGGAGITYFSPDR